MPMLSLTYIETRAADKAMAAIESTLRCIPVYVETVHPSMEKSLGKSFGYHGVRAAPYYGVVP